MQTPRPLRSVLLVDDEFLALTHIRSLLDWANCGYIIVGEAHNGLDALEKIDSLRPEIALVDVSMPVMDGVTLMRKLSEKEGGPNVIILSSYADFDYARETLRMGAKDYLLKHQLDADGLLSALSAAGSDGERSSGESKTARDLSGDEKFVRAFLLGQEDDTLLNFTPMRLITLQLSKPPSQAQDAYIPGTLRQILDGYGVSAARMLPDQWVLLCGAPDGDGREDILRITRMMRVITDALKKYHNAASDWFPSPICAEKARMPLCYRASLSLVDDERREEPAARAPFPADPGLTQEERKYLLHCPKSPDNKEVEKSLRELLRQYEGEANILAYRWRVSQILEALIEAYDARSEPLDLPKGFLADGKAAPEALRRLFMSVSIDPCSEMPPIIRQGVSFMRARLDAPITLGEIANHCNVHPSYFSHLFKKEMKMPFTQCLNQLRVHKAMWLLLGKETTAMTAAESVGYNHYNHFFREFKEVTGVTPSNFRSHPQARELAYRFDPFKSTQL